MGKERNKNYQLQDLVLGDRFHLLENNKTVYEIIGFVKGAGFNRNEKVIRVRIKNDRSKKESTKDPSLIVTYLRSTIDLASE